MKLNQSEMKRRSLLRKLEKMNIFTNSTIMPEKTIKTTSRSTQTSKRLKSLKLLRPHQKKPQEEPLEVPILLKLQK